MHMHAIAVVSVNLRIFDIHFLLCCGILNAVDGSRSPHKDIRESIPLIEAKGDDGDGNYLLEGLDRDNEA